MGTSGAHTVYLAPQLTGSDTLLKVNATGAFIRRLRGGGAVHFDAQLRHSSTVNRLGHTTTFTYDGAGRLWKLTVPPSAAAIAYELAYADTAAGARVASISVADSAVGVLRITTLGTDGMGRLTGITDPDSTTVSFAYLDSLPSFVKSRSDRRGYATTFEYDAGRRVSRGRLPFGGDSTFTAICAAESQGMTACAPTAPNPVDIRTVINGLRTDVADTAAFWVGSYGVWRARNARGTTTLISREDARFPALVTRLRENDGRVVAAEYNYNANVIAIVDSSHFVVADGNTTYATTRYTWHLGLNLPTGIYLPEGSYTQMEYNANGTLLWQQDARGTASRTNFRYTSSGQLRAIVHPGGAKDSLEFDGARENVSRTISPLGRTTRYVTDRVGRVTERHVLIHLDSALEQSDYIAYERNGRVVRQVADGPAHNASVRQRVFVSHSYDGEGNLLSTKRWQSPSPTGIDTLGTSWTYDPVGRLLAEAAPDGFRDSTVYNAAGLPIRHITRRGDTVRTTYDELGNVVKRVERSRVDTAFRLGAARINDSLPENPPYGNYAIPLDSALYTYDAEGRLLTASNRDAVVKRSYTPHGAIETDSLFIAYWDYSATHAYGLQYHYDLDGRMVRLDYPSQLVQGTSGRVAYAYDDTTGLLRSITGLQDEVFYYSYNARNEPVQLSKPGDIVELHTFDADGFLTQRRVRNLTAPSLPDRYPAEWIEHTDMTYDARGKLLSAMNAYGLETQRLFLYTGLGHLESQEVAVTGANSVGSAVWLLAGEEYRLDPMGNFDTAYELLDAASRAVQDQRHRSFTKLRSPDSFFYEAGTGRLHWMASNSGENRVTLQEHRYDRAGNLTWTGADNFLAATLPQDSMFQPRIWEDRVAYYDAAGRVRHAEKRRWHREYPYNPDINATLTRQRETYRYDALGRRVLTRSHNDCQNLNVSAMPHCDISSVVRTVWAGDQELVEVARPASGMPIAAPNDTATDAMMESDTDSLMLAMRLDGQGFGGKTYIGDLDPNRLFGRVAYVHGPGIDQPLSLTRLGYEARDRSGTGMPWKRWAPFTIVPLWSLRGIAEGGTFPNGAVHHRLEVPEDEYSEEIFVAWKIDGPAHAQPVYGIVVPWFGTLITNKYDGVGTMYRRNRHYDPTTGRFTQPDPIGLAGGLNLYGYAGGDPINFSDPFGLCPKSSGGDGKTEEMSDCPRGSSGWWAWRDAQGEGSSFVNNAMGLWATLNNDVRAQLPENTAIGEFNLPIGPGGASGLARGMRRAVARAQGAEINWSTLGSFTRGVWEVAGDKGAGFVRWNRVLNAEGSTVRLFKDVYDQAGSFLRRDWYIR
ncbi:MAG TPA: RHS repeat-associated core domain-containing protein [Gemmatimonadaceae bacterium]|nr:RHS repeat-associated core domain-containing protein [Gemmatimonadaceae bacterium]